MISGFSFDFRTNEVITVTKFKFKLSNYCNNNNNKCNWYCYCNPLKGLRLKLILYLVTILYQHYNFDITLLIELGNLAIMFRLMATTNYKLQ